MTSDRSAPRKTNSSTLARMRHERGLTQGKLAEMVGCRTKDISRWETGVVRPGIESLVKLAAALGCSIEALLK